MFELITVSGGLRPRLAVLAGKKGGSLIINGVAAAWAQHMGTPQHNMANVRAHMLPRHSAAVCRSWSPSRSASRMHCPRRRPRHRRGCPGRGHDRVGRGARPPGLAFAGRLPRLQLVFQLVFQGPFHHHLPRPGLAEHVSASKQGGGRGGWHDTGVARLDRAPQG